MSLLSLQLSGSALCRTMLTEIYAVDTARDGDRHDHIVTRGLAKRRMEEINCIPGNPFQFIVNFQIPGDPPVSVVVYFALPPHCRELMSEEEYKKFNLLLNKFINIPVNEAERLKAWFVRLVHICELNRFFMPILFQYFIILLLYYSIIILFYYSLFYYSLFYYSIILRF